MLLFVGVILLKLPQTFFQETIRTGRDNVAGWPDTTINRQDTQMEMDMCLQLGKLPEVKVLRTRQCLYDEV